MEQEKCLAWGKSPSPAQASVPAAPCKECPGALLSRRQLIMCCRFRIWAEPCDWSCLLVGKCLRSAVGSADIFSSAFLNRLSVSCTRVNSQIVVVFGTTRPACWSPDHWRGNTIMLISFFLFLSTPCCYDLQQVTYPFLSFLSSHAYNGCFLIPSSHPFISLIYRSLC